MADISVYQRNR